MSRDRWYITILILAFLALSVTLLLVRWHVLLGRVPLTPITPIMASANPAPATKDADLPRTTGKPVATGKPAATGKPEVAGKPVASATRLNLNTASAVQFEALPGIGPVLAQRIVDYRKQHGLFRRVDDLLEVEGIGAAKLDDLRGLVEVAGSS